MPVVAGARRQALLDELVSEIEAAGGRGVGVRTDVTSEADCRALVDAGVEAFGPVYGVFANAGYGAEGSILETPGDAVRAIFETNLEGSLNVIRPGVESMRRSEREPRGHVLLCSSCIARMSIPNLGVYGATKAAQAHLGSALRAELRPVGIAVSTVHPLGVRTAFIEQARHVTVAPELRHQPPKSFTQSAEVVAGHILRCLRRPRPEVWTGPRGTITRLTAAAVTAWPRFGDAITRSGLAR